MVEKVTTTPYYYAGDRCSIVAFFVQVDGVRLSITWFKPDEEGAAVLDREVEVCLSWKEFANLAFDAMQASAGRSKY